MEERQTSSLPFANQAAIVTGGGQGLGEAITKMLAENGCAVMIFDVVEAKAKTVADTLRAKGQKVEWCRVDVADEGSVSAGFETFRGKFERLDVMVNCAGIVGPHAMKVDEVNTEDFDRTYQVNVRGSFLMTKYSLKEMKKNDYGRILHLASIAGKEGNPGMAAYSCSKAAVIGLVKSVGKEYAESGITVNALAPAVVRTTMVENMIPAQVKALTDKIPKKRCATVEEVASIVKFIVSKEASFNTACCFDLTGGRATY